MKSKKVIVLFCFGAFAASIIPYRIRNDKKAGTLEVRSLLVIPDTVWDYACSKGTKAKKHNYLFRFHIDSS